MKVLWLTNPDSLTTVLMGKFTSSSNRHLLANRANAHKFVLGGSPQMPGETLFQGSPAKWHLREQLFEW